MTKRMLILGGALLPLLLGMTGCDGGLFGVRGSGNVITESREVSGFNEIALRGNGTVVVVVDGTESLTIEAEDNIMPLLTSEVSNGRLELSSESSISPTREIRYTISAAVLGAVSISGSGDITVTNIDAESFDAEISGSGRIEPRGTTAELNVGISGSGDFEGEGLAAAIGSVRVSGSGNAVVNVSEDLDVTISGSGDVQYTGNPSLTSSVSGSGDVTRR